MNNILKISVTLWLILIAGKVIAQHQLASNNQHRSMKSNQYDSPAIDLIHSSPLREDSTESFRKNYPALYQKLLFAYNKVEGLRYSVFGNSIYIQFNNQKNSINTVYSLKGKQQYTIINLAHSLSKDDSVLIRSSYPDYTVFYSKEILCENNSIVQVILENKNSYKIININNREIIPVKDINK